LAKTNLRKAHKEIQTMQSLANLTFYTPILYHACLMMVVQEEGRDGSMKNNRSLAYKEHD